MRNHTFVKYVLLLVAGICAAIAISNYVVDPYGKNNVFNAGFNKIKIIKDERISKFQMLRRYPGADSFIFGSSRGLLLRPEMVESIVDGVALNMSFSSATADEYLLYIRYLFQTRKVRNIIIGVDLFAYADGFESTGTLPQELRDYFNLDSNYPISNYFSLKMFKRTIKALSYNLSHDLPETDDRYTGKGQVMKREYIEAKKSEKTFNEYINQYVVNRPARWATRYDRLDQKKLDALTEIKRLCQVNGSQLYLFMSPLYIKQIVMSEGKFPLQKKLLKYIVNNIQPVFDYNGIDAVNATATNFLDEFHYSYDLADSIIMQIMTGRYSNEGYKGEYIDNSNLDSYLDGVSRRYLNYVQADLAK